MRKTTWFIVLLVIILGGLFIKGLRDFGAHPPDENMLIAVYRDFASGFIQFVLIGLIGSLLLGQYNRYVDYREELKDLRKETYKAIVDVYLQTKCVRWSMRSACNTKEQIKSKTYRIQMRQLIELKSKIEVIHNEIKVYDRHVLKIKEKLDGNLEKMESCLRDLLDEYSSEYEGDFIKLDKLPVLTEFLKKAKNKADPDTGFTIKFRKPFYEIVKAFGIKETGKILPSGS